MLATRSVLLIALFTVSSTLAFAPPSLKQSSRKSAIFSLEVVDEDAPLDPFDSYSPSPEQTEVAFKDTLIGGGKTVSDEESQQLKIKYKATFLDPNPGAQFDFSDNFLCKTGQNKVVPGFEEGLKVR